MRFTSAGSQSTHDGPRGVLLTIVLLTDDLETACYSDCCNFMSVHFTTNIFFSFSEVVVQNFAGIITLASAVGLTLLCCCRTSADERVLLSACSFA